MISLLNGVLSPLRRILADVQSARTAPLLERGVPGTDRLATTRRLADAVPGPALAYLQKLSLSPARPAPAAQAPAPKPAPAPASAGLPTEADDPRLPAWKRYQMGHR